MDRKAPLRVALATLGCKVNQSDAADVAGALRVAGHDLVPFGQPADVCVLHTCTVTARTDAQSRQLIRRAVSGNPHARIIVTGCYARVSPESLRALPGIDYIVGAGGAGIIAGLIACGEKSPEPRIISWDADERGKSGLEFAGGGPASGGRPPRQNTFPSVRPVFANRTRAYLKVQDGCNACCSFCIVPLARGRSRSLSWATALAKGRALRQQGCREIVLTGIHLGAWGGDLHPPLALVDLLQAFEKEDLDLRLRVSSIEPGEFEPRLIDFLARSEKVCPHLHIPLQSGDDGILRRMNRGYSSAFFEDLVRSLVRAIPGLAVGVDIIGGFPGEDDEAFARTAALLERLPLAYFHVFPFSPRHGTPAASFAGAVPSKVIKARCARLRELGSRKRQSFYGAHVGRRVRVLVEGRKGADGLFRGYARNYLPVLIPGDEGMINREAEVLVTEVQGEQVMGRVI